MLLLLVFVVSCLVKSKSRTCLEEWKCALAILAQTRAAHKKLERGVPVKSINANNNNNTNTNSNNNDNNINTNN